MSDLFNISDFFEKDIRPACRVAYTLNNEQPVRCTIVSDQPLFYMDYEGPLDEFEDEELGNFYYETMQEARLLEEIQVDLPVVSDAESSARRMELFLDCAAELSTPRVSECTTALHDKIIHDIAQSRMGRAHLESIDNHNVVIVLTGQTETSCYDRKSGQIQVNPALSYDRLLLSVIRELRCHWQHRQGALLNPLKFHPDHAIIIHRAQIADMTVQMIRIAWEMQLGGVTDAWTYLEASECATDLAQTFAREAYMDFRSLNTGQASATVFESWFLSERCASEDRKLIQRMLADHEGYVFDNSRASYQMTTGLLVALGEMPFGKNYLAHYAQHILEDPVFTEVRDRSNANFLWFIKFERSFRETEQGLQANASSTDIVPDMIKDDAHDGNRKAAEIISIIGKTAESSGKGYASIHKGQSATIIPFRAGHENRS